MNIKRLLPFILSGILPLSAFAQSSPAPSANVGGASAPRSSDEAAKSAPASALPAPPPAPDGAELTKLLKDFMAGASRNDPAMHERFWADDLIYTHSAGVRVGKADIMRKVREEAAAPAANDTTVYSAEDIRIQQYGNTAIVAFRLVGTTKKEGKTEIANYLNSGTFLKREDKWQVVNWQATKMLAEDEQKK